MLIQVKAEIVHGALKVGSRYHPLLIFLWTLNVELTLPAVQYEASESELCKLLSIETRRHITLQAVFKPFRYDLGVLLHPLQVENRCLYGSL